MSAGPPTVPRSSLALRVLGAPTLEVDGHEASFPAGRPGRLLASLLLAEGRAVGADRLVDDIWGEDPPRAARAAVHTTVARVRRALAEAADRLELHGAGYRFDDAGLELDSRRFLELLNAARAAAPTEALQHYEEALALWRGPAWAGFADDLARGEALRLEQARLVAREERARLLLATGRTTEAVGHLRVLSAEEPLREQPVALLMTALHRSGSVKESLEVYDGHRERLADELGLDPSAELVALHQQILQRLPDDRPPVPAASPATNPVGTTPSIPAVVTERAPTLHGRAAHLGTLAHMLELHRCVTVVGPGGVGKTSLVAHIAAAAPVHWWVDLARVSETGWVRQSAAEALDVEVFPGGSLEGALRQRLTTAEGLLVVDNCEHLLAETADLVADVLTWAPGVRVLATSRERLGVLDEHVLPLPPLQLPARDAPDSASPAVALFLERARAAAPDLDVGVATLATVSDLVRLLDGLPLAIELAASRVGTVTLEDLRDRLADRIDLLRTTSPRSHARHRTLTSTIAWSYDLLDADDRRAFRDLAVFAEWFDLPAAEAVLGDDAADRVARLVERSLLVRPGTSGRGQYRMLETLRAYARAQRDEDETFAVREAHASWAAGLAEHAATFLTGPDEQVWVPRVERAVPDFAAAVSWSVSRGGGFHAARIVTALLGWSYFRIRGDLMAWSTDVLSLGSDALRTVGIYTAAATHAWMTGRPDEVTRYGELGIAAAGGPDAPDAVGPLLVMSDNALAVGDLAHAREWGLRGYRTSVADDNWFNATLAACNVVLASAFASRATESDVTKLLGAAGRANNPSVLAMARYCEGEAMADTEPDRALAAFAEAVRLAEPVQNRLVIGVAMTAESALRGRVGQLDFETLHRARRTVDFWLASGNENLFVTCLRNDVTLLNRFGAHRAVVELVAATTVNAPARPSYGMEAERIELALGRARDTLDATEFAAAWETGGRRTTTEAGRCVLAELAVLEGRLSAR